MEKRRWFKILQNGKSFRGGDLTWSLPKKDKPGDWHEVEGPIVRCRNGFHLTLEPFRFISNLAYVEAYEAEYDGEATDIYDGHEIACRKVRLIRELTPDDLAELCKAKLVAELAIRDATRKQEAERRELERAAERKRREAEKDRKAKEDSPTYILLSHVWSQTGNKSWDRLNSAMYSALRLAIKAGIEFFPGDFSRISQEFNSGRWIGDGEGVYAMACGQDRSSHGDNPSAYQSYEAWRGRKPFIVMRAPDEPKVRLSVGDRFVWHVGLKAKVHVKVTSFVDKPDGNKPPYLVACSYKTDPKTAEDHYPREKVDKVFKITHDDIAAYHKAVRASKNPVKSSSV